MNTVCVWITLHNITNVVVILDGKESIVTSQMEVNTCIHLQEESMSVNLLSQSAINYTKVIISR